METINPQNLLIKIVGILERLNIDYFVTGGFAVSVWGRPRATFDIDIVVELIQPKISSLIQALRMISEVGYIEEEAVRDAFLRKGEFNFIDSESGIKVDFWITRRDELSLLKFQRRKSEMIDGQKVYFISPEDLILSKLEWYKQSESSRQLEDIESIFKISGEKLDRVYLKKWTEKLGVSEILDRFIHKK